MSAGEIGRPSVPHAMTRVRTDRARTLPPEDAETMRELSSPEAAAIAEVIALFRDPAGVTIETFLKAMQITQRQATVATRQADKLGVDLGVGRIEEKIDSMVATRTLSQKIRSRALLGGFVGGWTVAVFLGLWAFATRGAHREAAETIVAPAVRAEAKVLTLEDRMAATEERHEKTEAMLSELAASVERLNGAVVSLTDRLPPPEPTQVNVPPRRKKGLDE